MKVSTCEVGSSGWFRVQGFGFQVLGFGIPFSVLELRGSRGVEGQLFWDVGFRFQESVRGQNL
jgi:hypothetical protein